MDKVFVLLSDGDGTSRSQDKPFGVAVKTEDEAKRFTSEAKFGYTHSYEELTIFDSFDEGIEHWKEEQEKER